MWAADTDAPVRFDVRADAAENSLKMFSEQSGRGVIFITDAVRGVRTNAVRGTLTAGEALERLLRDTGLVATRDAGTGAFGVRRQAQAPEVSKKKVRTTAALSHPPRPHSRPPRKTLTQQTT